MPLLTLAAAAALALGGAPADFEAKANARSAQTAMETYYTDHQTYAGATADVLAEYWPPLARVELRVTRAAQERFRLAVRSRTGRTFKVVRTGAGLDAVRYPCSPAGAGGCPRSGRWKR